MSSGDLCSLLSFIHKVISLCIIILYRNIKFILTRVLDQIYGETASKHDFKLASEKDNPALRRRPLVQTSGTACPSRILDLSALKKQPKLL